MLAKKNLARRVLLALFRLSIVIRLGLTSPENVIIASHRVAIILSLTLLLQIIHLGVPPLGLLLPLNHGFLIGVRLTRKFFLLLQTLRLLSLVLGSKRLLLKLLLVGRLHL